MKQLYFTTLILLSCKLLSAQTPAIDNSVQLTATTQQTPPQIKLTWKKIAGATSYAVYRKAKSDISFGTPIATLAASDTTYTNTDVVVDSAYEYQVIKSGGSGASGYIYAAIKAPAIHSRGTILLLVDSTFSDSCSNEITQLMKDLRGDGWKVIRKTFLRTETVANIKSTIVNSYNADNSIKSVYILGHLAVPYSGNINPDGHGDHIGAWPADVFYADINGTWTDNSVNNTSATGSRNDNIPGDSKYDQSTIPSDAELQVGRIDFFNMPAFSNTEVQMMKNYLNKAHSYKMDSLAMLHRALVDDNFTGYSEPFAGNGYRNFAPLLGYTGTQAIDYISSLNTGTYQWSYGCGGGTFTSAGGIGNTTNIAANNVNGIFTMLFGSYFGDWDVQNSFLRAPLCANTPALTNCWAGRPHWFLHHMALGEHIGYGTLLSQNNTTLYQAVNNYGTRMVHIALLGDPSLRTDYMKPVSNVNLIAVTGGGARITWSASPDPAVIGYYLYSSDNEYGFYKKCSKLVNVTSYDDSFGTDGIKYYMVRAVKLQNTPSGSYYNMSLGVVSAPAAIDYPFAESSNVNQVPSLKNIVIYPNPGDGDVFVEIVATKSSVSQFIVTDMNGKKLYNTEYSINKGSNNLRLPSKNLPKGIYNISIAIGDNIVTKQWVKNK